MNSFTTGLKNILISIIIPVFNDAHGLLITLESIKHHLGTRKDIEIIVCNDGGGNHISQITSSYNVREVRLEKNLGSYAARNKGIEASKGKFLAFLDADQQITENWLDAGVASLYDADYAGGHIKINIGKNPSTWELVDEITAFPVRMFLENMHFAPTANLFIRKALLDKIGNFNESLLSGGDMDFGIRVFDNGFKQIYVPEAITLHPARNKAEQIKKLKRTAIGHAELAILIKNRNRLLFVLESFGRLIQVFIELVWRNSRYPIIDYCKNDKVSLRFINIKKFRKLIYYWNLMLRSLEIFFKHK